MVAEALVAIKNQMAFLEETKKVKLKRKRFSVLSATLDNNIEQFEMWLCQKRMVFSDQELADAQAEVTRLQQWLALLVYKDRAEVQEKPLPARLKDPLNNLIRRMKDGLVHTKEHQRMTFDLLKELEEVIPNTGLGISEKERVMIVKAMGLNRGHWFKCPKGHIYAIADCGGATEESRCPECNATIGGTQHRLREDNSLAPEMDGATQPAWPTAINNLDDYDLINNVPGGVLDDRGIHGDDDSDDLSDDYEDYY